MLEDTQFSLSLHRSFREIILLPFRKIRDFKRETIYAGGNNGALALIEEPQVKELPPPVALKETAEETPPV